MDAVVECADMKFVFRSEVWKSLRKWREYVERNPESAPRCKTEPSSTDDRETIEYFKEQILCSVFYGQEDILRALLETVTLPKAPEPDPDMDTVRAVMTAFFELYKGGGKDHWPNKTQVREAATVILNQAGLRVPKNEPEHKRNWPRIFRKAGLRNLPPAPKKSKPRVPRKSKRLTVA